MVTDSHEQRGYSSSPPSGEAVVLNSVSSTKTLDNSSATETKQINTIPIHCTGPKVFSVTCGCGGQRQLDVPLILTNPEGGRKADIIGMMDTGCTGSCIHRDLVRHMELTMIPFEQPIAVFNANGTPNIGGSLTHYVVVKIQIGDHAEHLLLFITDLGKSDLFLGHEWLDHHNPVVDWKAKTIEFTRCPKECERVLDDNERIFKLNIPSYLKACSMHIR